MLSVVDNAFVPVRVRRWAEGKAATTLLASLLVVALLLCHGAMGGFHQLAPQLAVSAQAPVGGASAHGPADHASAWPEAAQEAGFDGERPAGPGEGHPAPYFPLPGFYLAALLVVLLAAVLGSALRSAPALPILGSWTVRRPPPAAFLPGQTPTASSLQVFRL